MKRIQRSIAIVLLQIQKKYVYYVTHDMDKWKELYEIKNEYLNERQES